MILLPQCDEVYIMCVLVFIGSNHSILRTRVKPDRIVHFIYWFRVWQPFWYLRVEDVGTMITM